jgi:hypothetical protein
MLSIFDKYKNVIDLWGYICFVFYFIKILCGSNNKRIVRPKKMSGFPVSSCKNLGRVGRF